MAMGQGTQKEIAHHCYDPETIDLLGALLDDLWDGLPPEQQIRFPRPLIAERLLQAAAHGERDPHLLRARAMEMFAADNPDAA